MRLKTKSKLQVFCSIIAAAPLVACGAHVIPGVANDQKAVLPLSSSRTFHFTHSAQKFKVPQGVTELTITAYGAQGGGPKKSKQGPPGALGAALTATLSVTGGKLLFVYVGGRGIKGGVHGGGGGFNGGGGAFSGAFGGGGSSDVRASGDKLTDRLIVAAGGGGTGESGEDSWYHGSSSGSSVNFGGSGGVGGARTAGSPGGAGQSGGDGGGGATHAHGGAGGQGRPGRSTSFSYHHKCKGVDGNKGALHTGGQGADAGCGPAAGGGGGGYYGGGGGGGGGFDDYEATGTISFVSGGGGGGGGGSSFVENFATHVHWKEGGGSPNDGLVVIRW